MFPPPFTTAQDGQAPKTITDKERAVSVAKALAATTDKDVTVTAHLDAVTDRDVVFHPDGTNEKIWIIDMGRRMEPVVGQVYTNRGGGHFRCIAPADAGSTFYNAAGGSSNASGVFQNTESGWTFTAKGIIQYIDGTIEWDHSIDGRFEEVTA